MSNEDIIANLANKLEQSESDKAELVAALKSLLSAELSRNALYSARRLLEKYSHA
ncbi:TPA: hypothetical protein ACMDOB_001830 [Vibrio metschnikovii]|uniref:hypothetical protein n=1 Tax=Vibrio metschnikovii TaxID=28172 RepID=UPI002974A6FC|nr:hypothetical protein [Vibrio metschnikovii]EKO3658746.1 hypothetical protein [Vibrio metschnikovii]EKO3685636.1 hypothetical protein [Vibrio metschnikovii]EKO3689017.1 hypothetical protein [Vibrio metschnikovii]EKO3781121.1 hypothetical protein [Vibrio metschnikovii]